VACKNLSVQTDRHNRASHQWYLALTCYGYPDRSCNCRASQILL